MPAVPALTPVDLHNRLIKAEAGLRSVERALEALFRKVNVNRKRDPELDAVIEALAAMLHGVEKARSDRSGELRPAYGSGGDGMSLSIEAVRPENDPFGEPEALRVTTRDGGSEKAVLRAVIPTRLKEN